MKGNRLGDSGAECLAEALSDPASTLQELYVDGTSACIFIADHCLVNSIGPQGVDKLSKALATCTTLRLLHLDGLQTFLVPVFANLAKETCSVILVLSLLLTLLLPTLLSSHFSLEVNIFFSHV